MRRRNRLLFILLYVSIGLSFLGTYLLLFEVDRLVDLISNDDEITTTMSTAPSYSDYFVLSKPTVRDLTYPIQLLLQDQEGMYEIDQTDIKEAVEEQLNEVNLEVDRLKVQRSEEKINELAHQDFFCLNYATPLPIKLVPHIIHLADDEETDFEFNRILVTFDDLETAYLVNDRSFEYVEAQIQTQLNVKTIMADFRENPKRFRMVNAYKLKEKTVYLPINVVEVESRFYTLDRLPETALLQTVFSTPDYEMGHSNHLMKNFFNRDYSLTLYPNIQLATIESNQIQQEDDDKSYAGLANSIDRIRRYEFWSQGMRYSGQHGGIYTFRRYLNTYPVFMNLDLADYGATRILIRNISQSMSYRVQMPMLFLQFPIKDFQQTYELIGASEMIEQLEAAGYSRQEFDDIVIGYEWQAETENNKRAEFLPKWYLSYGGYYYTFDDIMANILDKPEALRTPEDILDQTLEEEVQMLDSEEGDDQDGF